MHMHLKHGRAVPFLAFSITIKHDFQPYQVVVNRAPQSLRLHTFSEIGQTIHGTTLKPVCACVSGGDLW
jgi:hypothetical protein